MVQFFQEFKNFAVKGNVIDLAVGIIIGGAFNKIVSSFVSDIILPPIGFVLGKVDFSNLFINLGGHYGTIADAQKAGAPTLNYGIFINNIISFVITAFAVFLMIRTINRWKSNKQPAPTTKTCEFCSSSIPLTAKRCPQCTSILNV